MCVQVFANGVSDMSADHDHDVDALNELLDAGWISEVLFEVKSGKEATVYCCRRPPLPPGEGWGEGASNGLALRGQKVEATLTPDPSPEGRGGFLAAKVYRDLSTRRFRNSAIYQAGRVHLAREGRARRAAENRTAFGREMEQVLWIDSEWEIMQRLFDAGLDVPQPLQRTSRAILMPFFGDHERGPAPMLHQVDSLSRDTASGVIDRLLWSIEAMLDLHVVHGDLSPFNIMWHGDRAIIIDFPQAVDPRLNPAAQSLLERDISNVCEWAQRFGVRRNAGKITADLWSRFVAGEIG
jgi:RIO kinase 1